LACWDTNVSSVPWIEKNSKTIKHDVKKEKKKKCIHTHTHTQGPITKLTPSWNVGVLPKCQGSHEEDI